MKRFEKNANLTALKELNEIEFKKACSKLASKLGLDINVLFAKYGQNNGNAKSVKEPKLESVIRKDNEKQSGIDNCSVDKVTNSRRGDKRNVGKDKAKG